MTLREWLDKTNNRHIAIANKIGVSSSQFSRYVNGSQVPTLFMAHRIWEVTKGKVTLNDWIEGAKNAK